MASPQIATRRRAALNHLKGIVGPEMVKANHPSPGFIRVLTPLKNSQSVYNIGLTSDSPNLIGPEEKLAKTDIFQVDGMLMFFYKRNISTGPGKFTYETFPNPNLLDSTNTIDDFYAIYNGRTSLKVGNRNPIDRMDNLQFLKVPSVQKASINAVLTGPVSFTNYQNEFDLDEAVVPCEPLILLRGNQLPTLVLEYDGTSSNVINASPTANIEIGVGFYLRGFRVANAML